MQPRKAVVKVPRIIQQRPTPWPLFGLAYRGGGGTGTCSVSCRMGFAKARMCTALSVKRRWHTFCRKGYQRWRTCSTHGWAIFRPHTSNPHGKWLTAADAIHLAMLVSFMYEYFLVSQEM